MDNLKYLLTLENMSNVILGKFPDKIIINDPEITSNDLGEKIVKIPTI